MDEYTQAVNRVKEELGDSAEEFFAPTTVAAILGDTYVAILEDREHLGHFIFEAKNEHEIKQKLTDFVEDLVLDDFYGWQEELEIEPIRVYKIYEDRILSSGEIWKIVQNKIKKMQRKVKKAEEENLRQQYLSLKKRFEEQEDE